MVKPRPAQPTVKCSESPWTAEELEKRRLEIILKILGSNHGVWLPKEQKVRANRWRSFEHIRWDGKKETRYIREIIYGKRRTIQDWEITIDKETVPEASTWFVMTKIPKIKYLEVGAIYGIRTGASQFLFNQQKLIH
jgi:SRSO17 transposase